MKRASKGFTPLEAFAVHVRLAYCSEICYDEENDPEGQGMEVLPWML